MKIFSLMVSAMLLSATESFAQDLAMAVNDGVLNEKTEVKAGPEAEAPKAEFVFPVYGEIPVAKVEFEEDHFLGDAIAKKWNTFQKNYTRVYDVEIGLTSSGSEIRKPAVFKAVGGFDERYFMYVEDADLTQKMRTKGKAYLVPQYTAIHAWHRAAHRSLKPFLWQLRSLMRYFSKWGFAW